MRAALTSLKKDKSAAKRRMALLRRELALEKGAGPADPRWRSSRMAAPAADDGKRMRSHQRRRRSGAAAPSQAAFAKLLGVSSLTVFKWERRRGKWPCSKARAEFCAFAGLAGAKRKPRSNRPPEQARQKGNAGPPRAESARIA